MADNDDRGQEMMSESQAGAIAKLPPDLALIRMEQDSIQALAASRPRNFVAIKEELAGQLVAFPNMAATAIYAKPVGKGDDGKMKIARNLSVRSAELLAECYGFNRVSADTTVMEDERVKIEASFTDYQKGRIWRDSVIVSPFYKTRGGQMARHQEDRFFDVVVKAHKSKLVREVILRSVNPALKAWFWAECEKVQDAVLDEKAIGGILEKFKASLGVTVAEIETYIGRGVKEGWTQSDRRDLLQLWNAIKDGETTVEEAFGRKPAEQPKKPEGVNGGVKGEELSNPKESKEPAKRGGRKAKEESKPVEEKKVEPASDKPAAKVDPDMLGDEIWEAMRQAADMKTLFPLGNRITSNDAILGADRVKKLTDFYTQRMEQIGGKT